MKLLPKHPEPYNNYRQLIDAWKDTLQHLDDPDTDDVDIAYSMGLDLLAAGHTEWWTGDAPTEPMVAEVAELVLGLEVPNTWCL